MISTLDKEALIKQENAKGMFIVEVVLVDHPNKVGKTEIYEDGNVRLVVKYE